MEENKTIRIAPKSMYLLTVHAMFKHLPDLRTANIYPPSFEISHDTDGENSVGRYHTEFMDLDLSSDDVPRALIPAKTSIIIYPDHLSKIIMGEFQLEKGQGFQIALAFAIHTIMHEFFHHVRNHRHWCRYIRERYVDEIPADVAYSRYRHFIMGTMESPEDEQYTEENVIKHFKQIWAEVAPWDQSNGLVNNFTDYFRQCYIMSTLEEGTDEYEAGLQNIAEICTAISELGKMMPMYEFIDG